MLHRESSGADEECADDSLVVLGSCFLVLGIGGIVADENFLDCTSFSFSDDAFTTNVLRSSRCTVPPLRSVQIV
jgi:hypothetical protein